MEKLQDMKNLNVNSLRKILSLFATIIVLSGCGCNQIKNVIHGKAVGLNEFDGDTIAYCVRNFEENKEIFINKKFSKLYKQIEFPVYCYFINTYGYVKSHTLELYYLKDWEVTDRVDNNMEFCSIVITFYDEYAKPPFRQLRNPDGTWSEMQYEFLKDFKIKDVNVIKRTKRIGTNN